jgi:hypothetical protein
MNTIQKTAAKNTAKIVAALTALSISVPMAIYLAINFLTVTGFVTIAMLGLLAFMIKMLYESEVSKLESMEKLDKTTK